MDVINAIREKINMQLPFLREKYHVKQLGIFGSFAKEEQNQKSDLDMIVEFETPIGFFDFIRLESFLSVLLNKKVDLVTKKALKPAIKEYVLKEIVYV